MVEAFALLIREIRRKYGYRQKDLAEVLGTSESAVGFWERDTHNPSLRHVDELTRCFPEYRSRLYVTARFLPRELDALTEHRIRNLIERETSTSSRPR